MLTYNASNMKLAAQSDASYLSKPKARSQAGGHFFLSNNSTVPHNNGAVLNTARIIKHVMISATEAELAALYIMAQEAVSIHVILEEMGYENHQCHYKQITQWQMWSSMEKSNQSEQKR